MTAQTIRGAEPAYQPEPGSRSAAGKRHGHATLLTGLCCLAVLAFGCSGVFPRTEMPSPSTQVMSREDLESAIRFRTKVGFRTDAEWVLRVAADPASRPGLSAYGTPLLPAEKAELDRRARNGALLSERVESYGIEHPDEWAGSYLEIRTGVYVALFTGSLEEHEAALRQLVGPAAMWAVRAARWSYADLGEREHEVASDVAWLASIGARYQGIGVDVVRNAVVVKVSSGDPEAPARIIDHYEGRGWLLVDSDGIGDWSGGYGAVTIRVLTRGGDPGRYLLCSLVPDEPSAALEDTFLTGSEGACRIDSLPATSYTVEIKVLPDDGSPWTVIGRDRLEVRSGREAELTVRVDQP